MQWRADALPGILKFGKDLNCVANTFVRRDGTGWAPNVGTVGTWQPIKQGQPNFLGSKWYPLPGAVLDSRLTTSNPDCRLGSKKVNFQIWPMFHDFPYEIYEWRYDSHYLPLFWCENMSCEKPISRKRTSGFWSIAANSRRVKSEMRDTSGLMFMGNARLIQGVPWRYRMASTSLGGWKSPQCTPLMESWIMGFKLLEVIGNQSTCCNDATHVFRIVDGSNWMFQVSEVTTTTRNAKFQFPVLSCN